MESTATIRFRESVTRLPDPIEIGSDYSIRPIPGQQALTLAAAGYREQYGTPPDPEDQTDD